MVRKLDVWLFTDHVGTLALIEGQLSYQIAQADSKKSRTRAI
jgi:hypothetical protein